MNDLRETTETIELCLCNKCNLRCPLCVREEGIEYLQATKNQELDFDVLKKFVDWFPNLQKVIFIGTVSEATTYSHFMELMEFVKSRNLSVRLSTNGHTHNERWWKRLGRLLDKDDIVRFPVEGSTNELHTKYRVGSSLQNVLANHRAFKFTSGGLNTQATTVIQTIKFQYNQHDMENVRELGRREGFDVHETPHCWPIDPMFAQVAEKEKICPVNDLSRRHHFIEIVAEKLTSDPFPCYEVDHFGSLYLSFDGTLLPCNEQEDQFYGKHPVSIYDGFEEAIDFVYRVKENRQNSTTCGKSCSKVATANVCSAYPIDRYIYTNEEISHVPYRCCMILH